MEIVEKAIAAGFQRAEFLLEHGFLDAIVPRKEMRAKLAHLLRLLGPRAASAA